MSAEPVVPGDDNDVSTRWATFKDALATGDWTKVVAWQESERQQILAFVDRAHPALPALSNYDESAVARAALAGIELAERTFPTPEPPRSVSLEACDEALQDMAHTVAERNQEIVALRAQLLADEATLPAEIYLDALERAFIAYWKDFGTSRHNLTAAIREYVRTLPAPEPSLYAGPYITAPGHLDADFVLVPRRYVSDGAGGTMEGFGQGAALPAAPAPPDDKRLSEIRARLDAATPGPWRAKQMNRPEDDPWFFVLDAEGRGPVMETVVAQTKYLVTPEAEQRANVEFIAHAPEDVRMLLDLADRMRACAESVLREGKTEHLVPAGPWRVVAIANTWTVVRGTSSPYDADSGWYSTEVEAIAVRDALNLIDKKI